MESIYQAFSSTSTLGLKGHWFLGEDPWGCNICFRDLDLMFYNKFWKMHILQQSQGLKIKTKI